MNRLILIVGTLISTSIVAAAHSCGLTEQTPLITRSRQSNYVWDEINTVLNYMAPEGKSLPELKTYMTPHTFDILSAYIASECPRESLLNLYALFLNQNENNAYIQVLNELLRSADRCDRCS